MTVQLYEVMARNPATASENRIHSDETARRFGFRGGLVPGVTTYGYMVAAIVDALGEEWVISGTAQVRFRAPVYDGDVIAVAVGPAGELSVTSKGVECVTGTAGPGVLTVVDLPLPGVPDERPPASPSTLAAGTVLGAVVVRTDAEAVTEYLDKVSDPSPLYRSRSWVHPGMLLEGANWVLSGNVVLPPWVHVSSEIAHRRPVVVDEALEVRGQVSAEFEKKGRRFVTLDVGWYVGDEVVAGGTHTAIWRLAEL